MASNRTKDRKAADNVLPKVKLNGFDWTFVQGSTIVLQLNFWTKITTFGNTLNVRRNEADSSTVAGNLKIIKRLCII